MSREALLGLQRALVADLTGARLLREVPTALSPLLDGLDAERLALLARLTQGKRLGKIVKRLPVTFEVLRPQLPALAADFAADRPLYSASGYRNAVQFYRFLVHRHRRGTLSPAWVKDLAACELAVAAVSQREVHEVPSAVDWERLGVVAVRRPSGLVLFSCDHDVLPVLRGDSGPSAPVAGRRAYLAVVPDHHAATARILELDRPTYTLLRGLREWRTLSLDEVARDDDSRALLTALTSAGLLRVAASSAGRTPTM